MRQLVNSIHEFINRNSKHPKSQRKPAVKLELELLEDRIALNGDAGGIIEGVAFVDGNVNGVFDANEAALPGIDIVLTGTATLAPETPINATATTDASGAYRFENVVEGSYNVNSFSQSGFLLANGGVDIEFPELTHL